MTGEPQHPAAPSTADDSAPAARSQPVAAPPAADLSDGDWHRLHPASPLLKGGLALIAIVGVVIANWRDRLIEFFVPQSGHYGGDPVDLIVQSGLVGWALLIITVVLVVLVSGFYVSWRMHTFRVTNEVVEVRSGVLFRTNRKARLDRIQGINIVRPFFARLFGAARLEVNQAGQDANVKLEYLASGAADDLRREILRLASGTRAASATGASSSTAAQTLVDRRLGEFLAPELDPSVAQPESVVQLSTGRLVGSIALSGATVVVIGAVGVAIFALFFARAAGMLVFFALIPAAIGVGGYYLRKLAKSLRYSIAGTPDGVRVGFGLLSTSNETLPPGRIHSVKISQPLLWRPFGWWQIEVNRASHSSTKGAAGEQNTTILPVGDLADVMRVLELVLPDVIDETVFALAQRGLTAAGSIGDGFTNSPRRAVVLRPFSWRRNGFAISPSAVLLREGAIWRELTIVPLARLQSVQVGDGPILRMLRLASVHLHTVAGPISARLGAIDRDSAVVFFDDVARTAVRSSRNDTSHRWRSGEVDTPKDMVPRAEDPRPVHP